MVTTLWGYPATLRLEVKPGRFITLDEFLKWSDEGNAPAIDLEKIRDAVAESEMRDHQYACSCATTNTLVLAAATTRV